MTDPKESQTPMRQSSNLKMHRRKTIFDNKIKKQNNNLNTGKKKDGATRKTPKQQGALEAF